MKETILYHDITSTDVTNKYFTLTGFTEASMSKDNVLAVINETKGKVLYGPTKHSKITVDYVSGTPTNSLKITFTDTTPNISENDHLLIKLQTSEELAKEGTLTDFRADLMGANGVQRLRPLLAVVGFKTANQRYLATSSGSNAISIDDLGTQSESLEDSSFAVEEGERYSFPFAPEVGYENIIGPGGRAFVDFHYYVPTAAPQTVYESNEWNISGLELAEVTAGTSFTCVEEVKYYSDPNDETTYLGSVYVYSVSTEGTETNLADIRKSIEESAGGRGDSGELIDAITGSTSGVGGKSIKEVYEHIPTIPTDYAKAGTPEQGQTAPTMVELGSAIQAIPTTTPATESNVNAARDTILEKMFDHKTFMKYIGKKASLKLVDYEDTGGYTVYGIGDETTKYISGTSYYIIRTYAREYRGNVQIIEGYAAVKITTTPGGLEWGTDSEVYEYNASTNTIGGFDGYVSAVSGLHVPTDYAKDSSVKDGNDTVINVAKSAASSANSAASSASSAATDAGAIKTALGDKNTTESASSDSLWGRFKAMVTQLGNVFNAVSDTTNNVTTTAVAESKSANSKIGTPSDATAAEATVFGWFRKVYNYISVTLIDTITGSTSGSGGKSNLQIYNAMALDSTVAKESAATTNKTNIIAAINNTLSTSVITAMISEQASTPFVVIPDNAGTALLDAYEVNQGTLYYVENTRTDDLYISFENVDPYAKDGNIPIANECHFIFHQPSCQVSFLDYPHQAADPSDREGEIKEYDAIVWQQGLPPQLDGGQDFYEVGIMNGIGLWMSFSANNN